MTEESTLVRAILASPGDDALREVYADWLEERGDPRAEYLRLLGRLSGACPPPEGERAGLLARLDEIRAGLDSRWVGQMHRGRALAPSPDGPGDRLFESAEPWVVWATRRRRKRPFNEAEVSTFLQKYARGCRYSHYVEKRVKRMKPEALDRLLWGEEE
jgi:uncharacterized protein (TIGR02996 family)